ncbi:ABC transporter ATP-binding protein [Haliea sp. E1-2-M8]|uniref:ABC transporter ATP-binding protein n=1 Tax=Haliea sp. E1-2-M8 TaxID=3064706 RepID=UPI0027277B24|nr:ABC transporter ATP-binding protein [Haliea sp. E1-2-M8]MDO8862659.1 ABC transporter ATP-binding protein [Haliea sp. E1-2-M8]
MPLEAPQQPESASRSEDLRWLAGFLLPHRVALAGLLLLSVSTSLLVLIQPYLTKLLIDDALLAGRVDILLIIVGLIFGAGLLATILSGLNRYCYTRLSGRVLFAIRELVYRHLQTLSPAFFSRNRSGDILARLDGDVAELQRFSVDSLFAAVSALLGLVGTIGFMLLLSWQLTMVLLVVSPLQWLYLRFMRPRVQEQTRQLRERSSDISAFLVETLPAMKFIQGMASEGREAVRLGRLNSRYLDRLLHLQLVEFATAAVPNTLTSAGRATVFLIGGYWVIQGQLELGSLIAFASYLGMAAGPVQGLLGLYMSLARVQVSLERVRYLLDASPDVDAGGTAVPPERLWQGILLDAVSFHYPLHDDDVLQGASLEIPAGSSVGLQSPSGSGKTTLVDLLLRHYDPQAGSIQVDGINLREFDLSLWRSRIALVAQDIVLFRGSICDNIRYARPDASDAEVEEAAQRARLGGLAKRLPLGLDTPVGDRGTRLSGGERQRIAIARALLQQPLLVILDEATSAVDQEVEQEVLAMVNQVFAGQTRLLISHRDSALGSCDGRISIVDRKLEILWHLGSV